MYLEKKLLEFSRNMGFETMWVCKKNDLLPIFRRFYNNMKTFSQFIITVVDIMLISKLKTKTT